MVFKFENGVEVKDSVTGFAGVVTGRANYLTGCNQYSVQPKSKLGEWKDGRWFDENRLIALSKKKVEIKTDEVKGADFEAPLK